MDIPDLKFTCCTICVEDCQLLNNILNLCFLNPDGTSSNHLLSSYYISLVRKMLECKLCVENSEFYIYKTQYGSLIAPSYDEDLEDTIAAVLKKYQLMGFAEVIDTPLTYSVLDPYEYDQNIQVG